MVTPPESPASLLGRAAQRLEELAAHFEPYEREQGRGSSRFQSAAVHWASMNVPDTTSHLLAREWMWVVTPAVAAPLCAILRGSVDHPAPAAIDLARAILGEPAPGEDSP